MQVNFRNLARQELPPLKRLPSRLGFVWALIAPLTTAWRSFDAWRREQRMLINVYGCQLSMEGWLRYRLGNDQIKVVTRRNLYPRIGLRVEGRGAMVQTGLRASEAPRLATYLRSDEITQALDVDFEVYAPQSVDLSQLKIDIERIKPYFATYKIKAITR